MDLHPTVSLLSKRYVPQSFDASVSTSINSNSNNMHHIGPLYDLNKLKTCEVGLISYALAL